MRAAIFLPVVLACACLGQASDPDPVELMRKSAAPRKANEAKVRQYAFRERQITRAVDKNGKESGSHSETWDVIGLEGSTYRRLVLKNDKPLPRKEEKREEERLQKEAERRRKETPEQRRNRLFSFSYIFTLDMDRAADIYDLVYKGEEVMAGRRAWVIEGVPKPGFRPSDDQEKEALNYRMKVWLDQEDMVVSFMELEIITDRSRMQKGSVIRVDSFRNDDGVWLAKHAKMDFNIRYFKLLGAHGDFVITYSDYHKFQAESKILDVTLEQ